MRSLTETLTRAGRGIPIIHRWSTADVAATRRLEYYTAATSAAFIPVQVHCRNDRFSATVERAELGPLDIMRMNGTAHNVLRDAGDIARSRSHSFYLMMNMSARWSISHRYNESLAAGEAVFIDSEQPFELNLRSYRLVTLELPATWVRRWVRHPEKTAGRCVSRGSVSGRALADMMIHLTPRFAIDPPVPGEVIAERIGALLSLACAEADLPQRRSAAYVARGTLQLRVRDLIAMRCGERELSEADVAGALAVSPADVAKVLAARNETFEDVLRSNRVRVATRMLRSRAFAQLSDNDIAERAGFASSQGMAAALLTQMRAP